MYCQLKITLHAACVDIAGLNEYCNFCGLHLSMDHGFLCLTYALNGGYEECLAVASVTQRLLWDLLDG